MRIDRLLCYLRFCKTRSLAHRLVEQGHLRCNGQRVSQQSHQVDVGDIIAFPQGRAVRIVEILTLPQRRGPALEAQSHYRALDPGATSTLAAQNDHEPEGNCRS